jgi:hypothetical protein
MKRTLILLSTLAACAGAVISALAQMPVPPPAPVVQLLSGPQLDQLLGPIALYPDPLLAQILPAATLPSEIVLADRSVSGGGDPNLIDQQPWDPSVLALARYPALLSWLDQNLAWTTALGQAFLYQQQDVMDSIQRLRAQAQALGNLQSTPQENVVMDDGTIEILPANPDVIYVPVYQPNVVYFQQAYGAPFISFGIGCAIGAWLNHDFDWHDHHLIVWGNNQPRPANWWFRRPSERPKAEAAHATVWQPRDRPEVGARGLDRGWASHPAPSTVTVIGGQSRPVEAPVSRPASGAPVRSTVTVIGGQPRTPEASPSRPATGALIGIESSHQTQQFSSRGQESRQTTISIPASPAPRAAAPAHSEAPSHPAGGGRR